LSLWHKAQNTPYPAPAAAGKQHDHPRHERESGGGAGGGGLGGETQGDGHVISQCKKPEMDDTEGASK
jgi:hypothetical protein